MIKNLVFLFLLSYFSILGAQEQTYYPLGDPAKWNVAITPFAWLPSVSGKVEVGDITKDINASPIDLLSNLRGAAFMKAEVSKNRMAFSASYVFTKLQTDKVLRTDRDDNPALVAVPSLNMNILQCNFGGRLAMGTKVVVDPFVGFRYNAFHTFVDVEGKFLSYSADKKSDFWDPLFGLQVHYFPRPRVPLSLYTDIGGLSAGSQFSWNIGVSGGYSVCQMIDIKTGITAYGFKYVKDAAAGSTLTNRMYGLTLGCTVHLPKRYKDPALFHKSKKGDKS